MRRTKLYASLAWAVIWVGLLGISSRSLSGQFSKRPAASKGPRALGLLELAPSGAAHLIPITILYDGEFYDASAYKASPVPMALESGTVYEAVKTGVSQGLFTVTTASQVKDGWIGNGVWRAASLEPKQKKIVAAAKPATDDSDKPPVLRHADAEKPSAPAPAPPPVSPPPAQTPPAPVASAPAPQQDQEQEDEDRPVLRRGKPEPKPEEALPKPLKSAKIAASPAALASSKPGEMQAVPAISDAGGPEPRPYAYSLKPEEGQNLKKQMLTLAADEVRARDQKLAAEITTTPPPAARSPRAGKARAKLPQPVFDDVQFRVFDLSSSNEPVLVLCARAQMPPGPNATRAPIPYFVTVVARQTIYGELHKAFVNITDTQHLDAIPRMELIDAVDADGDGRGELLFRKVFDAGSAYAVYRVIGDQLWPLFDGTPGQ
ncbi:MAG TPA: hypothetical protein VLW84_05045 [Terriglobales bacterium]|nr:hypothetical protein [Terriglobales bacterium]